MNTIKNKKGFTLVELMVVLAIGAVMAAMAIPTFNAWLPAMRVNGCANTIASNMQWARSKAVAENNPYFILFDTNNNIYRIYSDSTSDGAETGDEVKVVDLSEECNTISLGHNNLVTTGPDGNPAGGNIVVFNNALLSNLPQAPLDDTLPTVEFTPRGTISDSGIVYIYPTTSTSAENVRSIQTTIAGRAKVLSYAPSTDSWR